MGFADNIASKIRALFVNSPEKQVDKLRRGENFVTPDNSPYSYLDGYDTLSQSLRLEQTLMQRFADYEEMDDYPEIGSAIDIYADDATIPDSMTGKSVWPTSKDLASRAALENLFYKRLKLDETVYVLARTLTKYGNCYAEIVADESGVLGWSYLPPATMRRVEEKNGVLIGYVQDPTGGFAVSRDQIKKAIESGKKTIDSVIVFEPWEIVNWRLQGRDVGSEYGHSVLEPARWIWRRLVMAEDSALVYKLTRSPARFAFYVDVGDLPPAQAIAYVNQVKQQYKKKKLFNTSTKKLEFRMNPLNAQEDFWVPSRNGQDSTRIDVIAGPDYQAVEDLEYFRSKLFSAIKVPASYLGLGGETSRAALSQEDVRFARTVMRIQREIRNGLRRVSRIHLALIGIDPDEIDFEIRMSVPSAIFELAQIELRNAQADNATRLLEFFPRNWVISHVFDFSEEVAQALAQEKEDEARMEQRTQTALTQELIGQFPEAMGMQAQAGALPKEPGLPTMPKEVAFESRMEALSGALDEITAASDRIEESLEEVGTGLRDSAKRVKVVEGLFRRRSA
jgi:hypothetical protein